MATKKSIVILLLFFTSNFLHAQFRIIGYIHAWDEAVNLEKLSFQKLTHLNIAFVNPSASGSLQIPAGFDMLVAKAHDTHVTVLASIGGGSSNPNYGKLISDKYRKEFIDKLVQFAIDHLLDGIDVDLENDAIDKNYEKFVVELSQQLKSKNKLITAALATWNAEKISDIALSKFDFVNIMSYDQTGPWRKDKPGPHSTFEKAAEDLEYWTVARGMAKDKVNLGLPFYGYCFGTTYGEEMSYKDIITTFSGAENKDQVTPATGGNIYYNGIPTIKTKTELAWQKAGGVMVWQILQDSEDDYSLLKTIYDVLHPNR